MAFPPKDSDKKKSPPPFMKNGPMTPVAKGSKVFKPGQNAGKLPFNDSDAAKTPKKPAKGSKKMCGPCTKKGASSCSHV